MDEQKWRLIDDDVIVTLIYDFEVEEWSNGNNGRGDMPEFKGYYSVNPAIGPSIPVLDLANKTALPKTLQR